MPFFSRNRLFQKVAVAIFWAYGLLMILVLMIGLLRPSGGTGIDASQIVITRHKVNEEMQKMHDEKTLRGYEIE